jgi:hypothetical protein
MFRLHTLFPVSSLVERTVEYEVLLLSSITVLNVSGRSVGRGTHMNKGIKYKRGSGEIQRKKRKNLEKVSYQWAIIGSYKTSHRKTLGFLVSMGKLL